MALKGDFRVITEYLKYGDKDLHVVKNLTSEQHSQQPIIFLHNGGGDTNIWKKQIVYFSKTNPIYAIDFIGHGESEKEPTNLSLESCVEMLNCVIDFYQIQKPILIGNCVGASTAIEYTVRNPKNVEKLILFNICGGVPMIQHQFYFTFTPWGTPWGDSFYHFLFNLIYKFEFLIKLTLKQSFSPKTTSDNYLYQHFESKIKEPWQNPTRIALIKSFKSFNKFYNGFKLPEVFPKHTIVWGKENQALSIKDGKHLLKWFRPDEFIVIDNCGHFPMAENPEEINQLISEKIK